MQEKHECIQDSAGKTGEVGKTRDKRCRFREAGDKRQERQEKTICGLRLVQERQERQDRGGRTGEVGHER